MARYLHLPVFQDTYDLVIEIHRRVESFPRLHRYSLGEKLKNAGFALMDAIIEANSAREKSARLERAEAIAERLKIYVRLAFDMRIFGSPGFEYVTKKLDVISRQISKWKGWSKKENHNFAAGVSRSSGGSRIAGSERPTFPSRFRPAS